MIWLLIGAAVWFVLGSVVALALGPVLRARSGVDTTRPDPDRRLTFEQSMRLIEDRYSDAIEELGRS